MLTFEDTITFLGNIAWANGSAPWYAEIHNINQYEDTIHIEFTGVDKVRRYATRYSDGHIIEGVCREPLPIMPGRNRTITFTITDDIDDNLLAETPGTEINLEQPD